MLLPGGRDISQPCLAHQLSLCAPGLYEESLLQHRDHVSKRNKFVGPTQTRICRYSLCEIVGFEPVEHAGNRSHRSYEYAHALCVKTWIQTCGMAFMTKTCSYWKWIRTTCPHLPWAKGDMVQKTWFSSHKDLSPRRCTDVEKPWY